MGARSHGVPVAQQLAGTPVSARIAFGRDLPDAARVGGGQQVRDAERDGHGDEEAEDEAEPAVRHMVPVHVRERDRRQIERREDEQRRRREKTGTDGCG